MSAAALIVDATKATSGTSDPADPEAYVLETAVDHVDGDSVVKPPASTASTTSDKDRKPLTDEQIHQKYLRERDKRLRDDGLGQYVDASASEKFKRFAADPWITDDPPATGVELVAGAHHRVVIVGAGFGGLSFAVHLRNVGFKPEDIVIVDSAGGFGGTWYWNRYPGLMCDTEAYIYMPFLEETEYMPEHKYAYGTELREHANRIARHCGVDGRAMFRTQVTSIAWQDDKHEWAIEMIQQGASHDSETKSIRADFVVVAPGLLNKPKFSDFASIDKFQGRIFHTARWDYTVTGGSPTDPTLDKLRDKRIGIIGTGATSIQAVPHLAKWCKELYVFQRTPSSVDARGQRKTDPQEWSQVIANKKGWQKERSRNFVSFTTNRQPRPKVNMVDDGWTYLPTFSAAVGGEAVVTPENLMDYIKGLHVLDAPRSTQIRARVDDIVEDQRVADSLKAWYPGWCKRPTFHDDYLPTFNQPNVHLVDTDGKGVDDLTERGIMANGKTYDLDIVIFSTGFNLQGSVSPVARASIHAVGRNGLTLEQKWIDNLATLHGAFTRDFPNLFFHGRSQGGASVNHTSFLGCIAQHAAFIIAEALKKAGGSASEAGQEKRRITIEPSKEAEDRWVQRIMAGAVARAAMLGCTPSYFNAEGAADRQVSTEERKQAAKRAIWPNGLNTFSDCLEEWRGGDFLADLDIRVV